jgi:parvulin-like peptidyl-prolyl isomerase
VKLRRLGLLPAVLVAASLTACGSGVAAGSGAGVAARVGDEVISVDDLSDVVLRALEDRSIAAQAASDKSGFQRSVLTRMVLSEVYAEAARDLDLSVTDDDVQANLAQIEERLGGHPQLLQAAAGMGLVEADIAPFVRDGMLNDAIATELVAKRPVTEAQIQAAYEANRAQFDVAHVQHVLVSTEPEAKAVLARLAKGEDFAAVAKAVSKDPGSKDRGGDLGTNPRGTFFTPFENAVFSAKIGVPVGPVQTEAGWHVIKVLSRQSKSPAEARADLIAEIRSGGREQARAEYLGALSKKMRIRVNPRFGRWDPDTASVVPADDELSSPEPAPGQVDPGGGLLPPQDPNQPPAQQPAQPTAPAASAPAAPVPAAS